MRALLSNEGNTSESMPLDTNTATTSTTTISQRTQYDVQAGFEEDIVAPTVRMESECSGCVQLKGQVLRLQKTVSYLKKRRSQLISSIRKVIRHIYYSKDHI